MGKGINSNLYEAEIKTRTGGRVTVRIECDNSSHARQLLEMKYGSGNVINLRQVPRSTPGKKYRGGNVELLNID